MVNFPWPPMNTFEADNPPSQIARPMKNSQPGTARFFRLLHFQSTATFGGDESNSLLLCRHLPEMRHRIAVYFGSGPMEKAWREAGAEVALLHLSPTDRAGLIEGVRETVAAVRPDGVYLGCVSLLPLVLKGLDAYDGEVLCHTGNPDATSAAMRLKFWTARAWLRPKARLTLVHCSEYVRKSYANNRFYKSYRHEVAISAGLMEAGNLRAHEPRKLARSDQVRVGMVARLDPIKNHRLVIEAFGLMVAKYPNVRLEFIGDGSEMGALKARALELGISERVIFHGRVPSPFPVMREWDLFLYGTTAAEGFGAALAEAMALGMPCVVTDIGPMREVGGEDGAVRYVSPASPVELAAAAVALLDDLGERRRMSEAARKRAAMHFDGARFAHRIASLLRAEAKAGGRRLADIAVT
jgi:glycosyltransferase involved in cell wall biosynthesis